MYFSVEKEKAEGRRGGGGGGEERVSTSSILVRYYYMGRTPHIGRTFANIGEKFAALSRSLASSTRERENGNRAAVTCELYQVFYGNLYQYLPPCAPELSCLVQLSFTRINPFS